MGYTVKINHIPYQFKHTQINININSTYLHISIIRLDNMHTMYDVSDDDSKICALHGYLPTQHCSKRTNWEEVGIWRNGNYGVTNDYNAASYNNIHIEWIICILIIVTIEPSAGTYTS